MSKSLAPEEKALKLKQAFGVTTMFTSDNDGMTLSEENATKCALIAVQEILDTLVMNSWQAISTKEQEYWNEVKGCLIKK